MTNVTALPGVQPRTFINDQAADRIQEVVDRIRSGDIVGIAWVTITPNRVTNCHWEAPTNLAEYLHFGVSSLSYRMIKEANE